MYKLILVIIITCGSFTAFAQKEQTKAPENTPVAEVMVEGDKIYRFVDQMPEFPGGKGALVRYLGSAINYPKEAYEQNIQGKVILQFVVSRSGKITNIVLKRDIGGGCGAEASRVVGDMPEWKPAMQDGEAVNVYYTLPVSFKFFEDTVSPTQQLAKANLAGIDTPAAPKVLKDTAEFVFVKVDKMPEFPGGVENLMRYLSKNINYPEDANRLNIQGKVIVRFVVGKTGKVEHVEVLRDIGGGCGMEAYRVVSEMPKWKPALQRGEPVRVYYTLPISFNLSDPQPVAPGQLRFR